MKAVNGQPPARKRRIGVLFGGRSGEHEVSLRSAESVLRALNRDRYDVVPIGITRTGRWLAGDVMAALAAGDVDAAQSAALLPDPGTPSLMAMVETDRAATLTSLGELDVIIPVLHGTYGEDGTVQGLLELAGVAYVGAGVVGSAVGMDKGIFKQVMTACGFPVLPWRLVLASAWQNDPAQTVAAVEDALRYPMFVKPANLGSSVGISKCRDRVELVAGLDEAAAYDRRIVVEQGADIRELEVAVLGNDAPIASVVGEIRPRREFYDYEAKYVSDDSELLIPAPLEPAVAESVRELAVQAYQAIDCAGLGRVDLMLEKETGRLYINEINTIPGFTSISMYPKLWEATGIPYGELLDRLISLAIERHATQVRRKTSKD